MVTQGPNASFFTHRMMIAKPEGFGPEGEASLDRYVLAQFGQRWDGVFARIGRGDYLMRLDAETTSDAYNLTMILAMSLFGRISTRAVMLEPLELAEGQGHEPPVLDDAETTRMARTLASFCAQQVAGEASAGETPATESAARADLLGEHRAALAAVEAASAETRNELSRLRSDMVSAISQAKRRPAEPVASSDGEDGAFNQAKQSAIAFAASLKSITKRVEVASASLDAATAQIGQRAAGVDAPENATSTSSIDDSIRELRIAIASVAEGQAAIAEALLENDSSQNPQPAAAQVVEDDSPLRDVQLMIMGLAERVEANRDAAAALSDNIVVVLGASPDVTAAALEQMNALAESNRDAAEQILDIAFAWQTLIDEGVVEADAQPATVEAEEAAHPAQFAYGAVAGGAFSA